jgi:ketosteroid isomerase-like protein
MRRRVLVGEALLASCVAVFPWLCSGGFILLARTHRITPAAADDLKTVAALDTEYQAAVKNNNLEVMNRMLADDFILVTGAGKVFTKKDLLEEARSGQYVWEHQEDTSQTVRLWGDTAVVTAKLWGKGTKDGKPFDHTLWFSDTYVRTPSGWRYVFGQASLALPGPS